MIASRRLSPVWQVAGVALAALVCYLVSQSVAAERAALGKIDRQIVAEQDAIAKLSTEIATRSRLTQIESWNRQLALQAPRPGQYVENGVQLASLFAHDAGPQLPLNPAVVAPHGPIQQVSLPAALPAPAVASPPPARIVPAVAKAPVPAPARPQEVAAARPLPLPARAPYQEVAYAAPTASAPKRKAPVDLLPQPLLRSAAYVRPTTSPLDEAGSEATPAAFHLSADIAGLAKAEQSRHKGKGGSK